MFLDKYVQTVKDTTNKKPDLMSGGVIYVYFMLTQVYHVCKLADMLTGYKCSFRCIYW